MLNGMRYAPARAFSDLKVGGQAFATANPRVPRDPRRNTPSAAHGSNVRAATPFSSIASSSVRRRRSRAGVPDVGFERPRATIRLVSSRFCWFGVVENQGQVRRGHPTDGASSTSDRLVDATALPHLAQLHSTHVDSRAPAERAIRTISNQISGEWCARSTATSAARATHD